MNTPARSFKGVLMLFVNQSSYARDSEEFINPNITKVSVVIEGKPNQLFANGMQPFQQYDECRKLLAGGRLRTDIVDLVSKDHGVDDVIESKEDRIKIKEQLKANKHSKLILKTGQPTDFKILI